MLRKILLLMGLMGSLALLAGAALADDSDVDADYPWRAHAEPFAFKFGNKIDSHQQSRIVDNGKLHGFLYIHDTGEYTAEGLPVAEPAKCPHMADCRVGWILKGVPIRAVLVNKSPRVWLVNPADLPVEPGYTHFHWLGAPHKPHDLEVGQEYPGMLLKRVAPEPFFWSGGGGSGEGGCGGHAGGDGGGCDSGSSGGCDSGPTGGCDSGSTGGCDSGSTGGCDEGDTGGCDGHDGGDTGGCGGSGGTGGAGGHGGRVVGEGIDPHTNIVAVWDGTWTGGCGGGDSGGCSGDTGGCDGHDSGDNGSDPGGCSGTDGGSCSG